MDGIVSFFLWLSNFPLYTCTISSLFIDLKVKVLVPQSCPTLFDPMYCKLLSVHGILQARILELVAIPLLQGIFPTQGSNLGLLYCRQILYCLSHQGRPVFFIHWSESESVSYSVVSDSSRSRVLEPARLVCPRDAPGKNTGVRCHSVLYVYHIFLFIDLLVNI